MDGWPVGWLVGCVFFVCKPSTRVISSSTFAGSIAVVVVVGAVFLSYFPLLFNIIFILVFGICQVKVMLCLR